MSEFFLKIINMSISASWLVLAVLLLRLVLKKTPKWVSVLLWGFVAIRLICPFSIESMLSLIPSAETISPEIMMDWTPEISTGIGSLDTVVNPIITESFAPDPGTSMNPLQFWIPVAAVAWIAGIAAMLIYTAVSYILLQRKVATAVLLRDNIFQSESVDSPFVLGIIKPRIYLPFQMEGKNLEHVIAHEESHIRRKDHWWKPLGFLLLAIHWFNPLMWLGYILLCRDIELACDEKVIKELDNENRADYTQALVACSVNRRSIAACPLAFGEVGVKERVKSVMNYKKPAFWIIIAAVVTCIVVAVCFLTNPINPTDTVLNKLIKLEDYEVVEQEQKNITLTIPVSNLPDSIYSESGKVFANNEIVAYKNNTTSIYLKEARYSNEGKDNLYFCFDFTFDLPKKQGVLFYPYEITNSGLSGSVKTVDGILRADNGEFSDAIADRGQGGNNLIWFYVSADALKQAQGTIRFDVLLNEITYFLDGDDYSSISNLGGVDGPSNVTTTRQLTLNDVLELSKKGHDLGWSDFEQFTHYETGSGLYIRVYPIDEIFEIWIGGLAMPDQEDTPMYIYLALADDLDQRIDIRDGGVAEFISKHGTVSQIGGADIPANGIITDSNGVVIVAETIDKAISDAILEKNAGDAFLNEPTGLIPVEAHYMLGIVSVSGTPLAGQTNHMEEITVYVQYAYHRYSYSEGKLERVAGTGSPAMITFTKNEDGGYTLKEFWKPHDGSLYAEDIRRMFPEDIADMILDSENDIIDTEELEAKCLTKAKEYVSGLVN